MAESSASGASVFGPGFCVPTTETLGVPTRTPAGHMKSSKALVPADLFDRVNKRITNTHGNGTRRPRSQPGLYLLSGAIRCGHCDKAMYGNTAKNKAYYRCSATRPDYAAPAVAGHPPTYMVREERILAAVDTWLGILTDPDHLDGTVATILASDNQAHTDPANVTQTQHRVARLEVELERVLAAIRAGMDPNLAVGQTRKIQADILSARSVIERWGRSHQRATPLTESAVRAVLTETQGLVELLAAADRVDRAALYRALGLTLKYEKEAPTGRELVRVRLELCGGGGRI